MSTIKTLNCKNCGGQLKVYSFGRFVTCPYCGTHNIIENENSSWMGGDYTYSRDCPVCRGEGSLVLNMLRTKWKCLRCGYQITPKQLKTEVFWFCDSCDAFLNVQTGFNTHDGHWKCKQCGYDNDVSPDNIFD